MDKNTQIKPSAILHRISVNTNIQGMTLASMAWNKSPIHVPLTECTLESDFCKGVKWGELIRAADADAGVYELEGVRLLPIFIDPEVGDDDSVAIKVSLAFAPKISRKIRIPDTAQQNQQKSDGTHRNGRGKKLRVIYFGQEKFDLPELYRQMPRMSEAERKVMRQRIGGVMRRVVDVDYIVTDTNNWRTETKNGSNELKYKGLLEGIAEFIKGFGLRARFLVLSEVLVELKRQTKNSIAARSAQRLVKEFQDRQLIYVPNATAKIQPNVIADPSIIKYVKRLYRKGNRLSVISNDQEMMILCANAVDNSGKCDRGAVYEQPWFITLEDLYQLYGLYRELRK